MSARGQALWALPVGAEDGPVRTALGRQPIRRDVYERYAGRLLPSVVNPYLAGAAMAGGAEMEQVNFGVLRRLVVAAAVDNIDGLRRARATLNRLAADPCAAGGLPPRAGGLLRPARQRRHAGEDELPPAWPQATPGSSTASTSPGATSSRQKYERIAAACVNAPQVLTGRTSRLALRTASAVLAAALLAAALLGPSDAARQVLAGAGCVLLGLAVGPAAIAGLVGLGATSAAGGRVDTPRAGPRGDGG